MANSSNEKRQSRRLLSEMVDHLRPLGDAMPAAPTGRVRSVEEARRALRIPTSSAAEILQLWGIPSDFQLIAYPVDDAVQPHRLVEFALLRVVARRGHDLIPRPRGQRLTLQEVSNALWVVYGSIATATNGSLVLESATIAPAFHDQLSGEENEPAVGITGQLLRLISPPRILAACAEQLLIHRYWLDRTAATTEIAVSAKQRDLLDRLDDGRPQLAQVEDDRLAEFAARYLSLYHGGERQLRLRLANEHGLTLGQARDRIHLARVRGYLTPGTRGRAGAEPGPRLLARGWAPPEPTPPPATTATTNPKKSSSARRRQ